MQEQICAIKDCHEKATHYVGARLEDTEEGFVCCEQHVQTLYPILEVLNLLFLIHSFQIDDMRSNKSILL